MNAKKEMEEEKYLLQLKRDLFWRDLGPLHKEFFKSVGISSARDLENMSVISFSIITGYKERGINSIRRKMAEHGLSFKEYSFK